MTGEGKKLYTSLNTLLQDYVFNEAYNKAGTAYMAGDYATAITEYTKAVAANPDSFDAINYLAWSYQNSGDTVNADKTFKEALKRFPAKASEIQPYITNTSSGTEHTDRRNRCQRQSGDTDRRNRCQRQSGDADRRNRCQRQSGDADRRNRCQRQSGDTDRRNGRQRQSGDTDRRNGRQRQSGGCG